MTTPDGPAIRLRLTVGQITGYTIACIVSTLMLRVFNQVVLGATRPPVLIALTVVGLAIYLPLMMGAETTTLSRAGVRAGRLWQVRNFRWTEVQAIYVRRQVTRSYVMVRLVRGKPVRLPAPFTSTVPFMADPEFQAKVDGLFSWWAKYGGRPKTEQLG